MTPSGSFVVLSDLDDTIKVSHTLNRFRMVLRGLFSSQVYAGMPELFQEWFRVGTELKIMSSSPVWIRDRIFGFLEKNRFPRMELILRDWIREKDIRAYKQSHLLALAKSTPHPLILIGDDCEWDPEVFHELRVLYPAKVLAIYIRRVRDRPVHRGIISFSTAFEIALNEYHEGRLTAAQVSRIGTALLDQKNPDLIIPYFVAAPEGLSQPLEAPFESIQSKLHDRLLLIFKHHQQASVNS